MFDHTERNRATRGFGKRWILGLGQLSAWQSGQGPDNPENFHGRKAASQAAELPCPETALHCAGSSAISFFLPCTCFLPLIFRDVPAV